MAKVQSALQLKEYAYRKLGYPKVEIQVDDTQAYDRIDDAVDLYIERHYDGVSEVFIPITFTAADEANKFLTMPDDIIDVAKIYESSRTSAEAMSDVRYQIMLDEVFDTSNVSMQSYEMTMQHLELIESYFSIDRQFTFNNASHRLYPTTGKILGPKCSDNTILTQTDCTTANETWYPGNSMLVRAFRATVPDEATGYAVDMYNDDWLKAYSTAQIKQQWGTNMKPFDGMPLPGGIVVNGQQIWDEATEEIKELQEALLDDELPVDFVVG